MAKDKFKSVNPLDVLTKLVNIPIQSWVYTNSPSVRHLGPVVQDFSAAFGLGEDDQHIATVDADGVALAGIQGLNQLIQEKDAKIKDLEKRMEVMERTVQLLFGSKTRPE